MSGREYAEKVLDIMSLSFSALYRGSRFRVAIEDAMAQAYLDGWNAHDYGLLVDKEKLPAVVLEEKDGEWL